MTKAPTFVPVFIVAPNGDTIKTYRMAPAPSTASAYSAAKP